MREHKLAAAGVLAAVLVGGGASIAAASPSGTTTPASSTAADQAQDGQDTTVTGSIAAPAELAGGADSSSSDAQEQAALQGLATVTPQQAEQAALAVASGTVARTDLGNENGSVVYSVDIKGSDGSVTEVKIDAGNAAVLAQGPADSTDQPESPNDAKD
jgi:uncharacterized membrane protein YkoI